jgi:hypothetical protein
MRLEVRLNRHADLLHVHQGRFSVICLLVQRGGPIALKATTARSIDPKIGPDMPVLGTSTLTSRSLGVM